MANKPDTAWSIYRIRKTPAEYLGRVYAADEAGAALKAIKECTDPDKTRRLLAVRHN
jgi:hypothetical protein